MAYPMISCDLFNHACCHEIIDDPRGAIYVAKIVFPYKMTAEEIADELSRKLIFNLGKISS